MLYTKIQPQSFLGSGEEDFKCLFFVFWFFLPYMVNVVILFNVVEPFKQIINTHSKKRPRAKSGENWSSGFREENIYR